MREEARLLGLASSLCRGPASLTAHTREAVADRREISSGNRERREQNTGDVAPGYGSRRGGQLRH
jgi:hypothetical protein